MSLYNPYCICPIILCSLELHPKSSFADSFESVQIPDLLEALLVPACGARLEEEPVKKLQFGYSTVLALLTRPRDLD